VSGAWTKARGDTDSFLASQEGESRMQRRRREIALLTEERKVMKPVVGGAGNGDVEDLSGLGLASGGKRPGTSEGLTMPVMKKRSLNTKKLKKQKSEGKLGLGKVSISYPMPSKPAPVTSTGSVSSIRPPAAPVYRATTGLEEEETGLRGKLESLETEISSLRAKLRWFEESYGEIPAETLVDIQHSLTVEAHTTKKVKKSAFKEEWGSMSSRNGDFSTAPIADESFLPREVKALKGFSAKEVIPEEPSLDSTNWIKDSEDSLPDPAIPPEQTIKLIQPSPSIKSVVSPPRARMHSSSPAKSIGSPTRARLTSASPVKGVGVPPSSPIDEYERSVDLLEMLSPIHPNIMPVLVPRQSGRGDVAKENLVEKMVEYGDM
jgi:hypothetical protein